MRRRLILVVILLMAGMLYADEFFPTLPPTVAWDASPTVTLPGDVAEYEVYLWDRMAGEIDLQDLSALTLMGATAETQFVLDIPYRSVWQVGVRMRHTDGGGNISFSSMIYSSVAAHTASGQPFVVIPGTVWFPVADPTGLRLE